MQRISLLLVGLGVALFAAQAPEVSAERAQAAGDALAKALGGRLMAAMQASGPNGAIEVCSLEALAITTQIREEQGLSIARITDRPRNPANRATAAEEALLAKMRTDLAGNGLEKRYALGDAWYLPLTIQPLCLSCHGENLLPDVVDALNQRYPEDEARHYALGELRGAIRIRNAD